MEWRNNNNDYPLKNAGNLSGIFCDASFVMFDNFVPILNSVGISNSNLTLAFTFDDGYHAISCPIGSAVEGFSFNLVDPLAGPRVYGNIVFGRSINDIIAGIYGNLLIGNISFENITVRTINSSNGVYSINGLSGAVTINTDSNIFFAGNTINAISIPSNISKIELNNTNYYINTLSKQLIDINNSTVLATIDKNYSAIINIGTNYIGVYNDSINSYLYNLNTIPAVKLATISSTIITSLTFDGTYLWGLAGQDLIKLGVYPFINAIVIYTISDIIPTSLGYSNNLLICSVKSGPDYSTSPLIDFSDMIYSLVPVIGSTNSVTSSLLGVMALSDGTNHLANVIATTTQNNTLYCLTKNNVYQLDPISIIATSVITYSDIQAISIFTGGQDIMITPIIPLTKINSTSPNHNNLNITGSDTISITEDNDTLLISLTVPDSKLNVVRSTQYV